MKNIKTKKYIKNAFICYLALLTGCSSNVQTVNQTNATVANQKSTAFDYSNKNNSEKTKTEVKEIENKYNLPTLGMKEQKTIPKKEIDYSMFATKTDYQSLSANKNQKTGDQEDLQSMAIGLANSETSDYVKNWFGQKHMTAEISIGASESGIRTGSFDLLVPLFDTEKDLFFTQIGVRRSNKLTEDYRNTVNLGLGYRHTLDKWLLGANTFYDRDMTGGNERLGLGLEAWTDFLKLSGNSYIRLSDWRQSKAVEDYQERPANGWDLRAEAYLPQYPQLGGKLMYEQYYGDEVGLFGSSNRQKDPSATTIGLSYTPIPLISMSTDYRQGQNGITETSVKLGLNFQLGVSLKKQLSSDELRASRLISNARYNLVSRNNEIVLDFKKNETGYIVLPMQLTGNANDHLTFPVSITGEVRNISWTGSASAYANVYGGAATASVMLPKYNNTGINTYTLQAIGSDKYGKVVQSNVMQINVEANKISVERSAAKANANGEDEVQFTATLVKANGENVPNTDVQWQVQGSATIVEQDKKTDASGKAKLKLTSRIASAVTVNVSEPTGAEAQSNVDFVVEESSAKVISITATPNTVHADGISAITLLATVQDKDNKPVGADVKVDWRTNLGTLSNSTSQTDSNGQATVTIVSNTIGSATITASAIKGSANTAVVFDAIPAIVNTLTLTANPESLNADGISKSSIVVTVKDSSNNPVNGVTVNWSKNIADTKLSATQGTTDSNGQTTVELTAGNTSGVVTVTATTSNGSGNKNITLNTVVVTPATIELAANPTTIKADGTSKSILTATLKDGSGKILPAGTEVNWSSTEGTLASAKSVTNGSGQATNTLTSSTKVGVSTVTAASGSTSKFTDVTFEGGYLTFASLTATPSTIKADNVEKTTIVATIKDENGNTVGSGVKVNFYHNLSSYGTLSSNSATTNSSGQASVTFNGSIAGDAYIDAEIVEDDSPYESVTVTLTPVADYNVSMTATPNRIKNDNIEYSNIVSHVTNDNGTPAVGVKVYFDGNGTFSEKTAITDSNGDATVRFKSEFEGINGIFSIPEGADQSKAANTFVEVYDTNGSNGVVSLAFNVTKDQYQTTETESDGITTTNHQNVYGSATATLTDINGIPVANKQILLECISGASCLSGDGSEIMPSVTLTTNSRGKVNNSYFKVDNENAGDIIFKATYVEDTNVYKTFNVTQFGMSSPPL